MKEIIEDIQQREQEQERLEKEREEAELKALEKELLPDESGTINLIFSFFGGLKIQLFFLFKEMKRI